MGKPRIGSPKLLFKHLDLTPIHPILWTDLHTHGPGRPVQYNPECDLRALMLRQLLQIPYVKDLSRWLRRDPYLRQVCGYGRKAPSPAHFTQMKKRIGKEGFRIIEAWTRHEALKLRRSQPLAAAGLVQAACIDGTDIPAWSSRDPHDTRRGRGDLDARVGRCKNGAFDLGYLSLLLVDMEGFPLGHIEAPLNVNEKQLVEELLTQVLGESLEVEMLVADSQQESEAVFRLLEQLKMSHIIAWRRLKGRVNPPEVLSVKDRIDVEGPEWMRAIYKRLRAAAESFNGRAKSRLALQRLTWQGLENVGIHVGLTLTGAYAVCIAAYGIGRPELRQSVAFFA